MAVFTKSAFLSFGNRIPLSVLSVDICVDDSCCLVSLCHIQWPNSRKRDKSEKKCNRNKGMTSNKKSDSSDIKAVHTYYCFAF